MDSNKDFAERKKACFVKELHKAVLNTPKVEEMPISCTAEKNLKASKYEFFDIDDVGSGRKQSFYFQGMKWLS